jgi:hypothetical protein
MNDFTLFAPTQRSRYTPPQARVFSMSRNKCRRRKRLRQNLVLCGGRVIHRPFTTINISGLKARDGTKGNAIDRYTFETCTSLAKNLGGYQPDDTLLVRMLLFWFEGGKPWGIAKIALRRNILLERDFIRLVVAAFFLRSWWSVDFQPVCCL